MRHFIFQFIAFIAVMIGIGAPSALASEPPLFQIEALHFEGGIPLHNLDYNLVAIPQYVRNPTDGRPWQQASAYICGQEGTVNVTLKRNRGFFLNRKRLWLRAVDPATSKVIVPAHRFSFWGKGTKTKSLDIAIPDHLAFIPLLRWEVRRRQGEWQTLEETKSRLCILHKSPSFLPAEAYKYPRYPKVLEVIAVWSSRWLARDPTLPKSPSDKEVMDSLFRHRGQGNTIGKPGEFLEYNHIGGVLGDTVSLLRHGRGLCGDWANYLSNLARTQGIEGITKRGFEVEQLLPPSRPGNALWWNMWITEPGMNMEEWSRLNYRHARTMPPCVITDYGKNIIARCPQLRYDEQRNVPAEALDFCWENLPDGDPLRQHGGHWWQFANHALVFLQTEGRTFIYDPSYAVEKGAIEVSHVPQEDARTYRLDQPGWEFVSRYLMNRIYGVTGRICVSYPGFEEEADIVLPTNALEEIRLRWTIGEYQ